jgi:hypothetical protein
MTDEEIDTRTRELIAATLAPPSREVLEHSARVIVATTRAHGHTVAGCQLLELYVDALDENEVLRARLLLAQKRLRNEREPNT